MRKYATGLLAGRIERLGGWSSLNFNDCRNRAQITQYLMYSAYTSTAGIAQLGERQTEDLKVRNTKLWQESVQPLEVIPRWVAPPSGRLKMNVDGSWNAEIKVAGFGAVIRGSDMVFVTAHCGSFEDVFSPLQSEAMVIVEALMDPCLNLSTIEQIVEDCKELLATVTEATISHQANATAHHLARTGLSLSHCCEWLDSLPSIIVDLLVEESHSSV
ncbi:hypothetical protein ACFX2B_007455 [Malus domestica]